MIAGGARAAVRSNYRRVCEIEVDEREAHPSRDRKGAFAGHAFSQRSLTGCPLGPALPGVRSTPGFSRLAGVYVNRLTSMSHTPIELSRVPNGFGKTRELMPRAQSARGSTDSCAEPKGPVGRPGIFAATSGIERIIGPAEATYDKS